MHHPAAPVDGVLYSAQASHSQRWMCATIGLFRSRGLSGVGNESNTRCGHDSRDRGHHVSRSPSQAYDETYTVSGRLDYAARPMWVSAFRIERYPEPRHLPPQRGRADIQRFGRTLATPVECSQCRLDRVALGIVNDVSQRLACRPR